MSELSIPERYRQIAAAFSEAVAGVQDWDAATPVENGGPAMSSGIRPGSASSGS